MKDISSIKRQALDIVLRSPEKIPPVKLEKVLIKKFSLTKKECKSLIRALVADEALTYTYHYGNTYIERSFDKPTRISSRIILAPPLRTYQQTSDEVVVIIESGASFGSGAHPTTRLSLKAIEYVLVHFPMKNKRNTGCLDIGTGSGVLVIAAVKLGLQFGLGLDIDPNALAEARNNAALNDLSHCLRIDNISLSQIKRSFSLITANLRPPTLISMANEISQLLETEGLLVLSGFRPEEQKDIETAYTDAGFHSVFQEEENEWACVALKKAG